MVSFSRTHFVLIAGLLARAAVVEGAACSVCGVGNKVGDPDAIFVFPGQPSVSCGTMEIHGEEGLVSSCDPLTVLIKDICDCQPTDENIDDNNTGDDDDGEENPSHAAPSPVAATPASCSVCGAGKRVGSPNCFFRFPGQPDVPCGILESAGKQGLIPMSQCHFMQEFLTMATSCDCNCQLIDSDAVIPAPAPTVSVCSVCGDGLQVGYPDNIFAFPGQPNVSCGVLELNAANDLLPLPVGYCSYLPLLIALPCGCRQAMNVTMIANATSDENDGSSTLTPAPPATYTYTASAPSVSTAPCSICGVDKTIRNPDAIFAFPGQSKSLTCSAWESAGEDGMIPALDCSHLPSHLGNDCGCRPIDTNSNAAIQCSLCREPGSQIIESFGMVTGGLLLNGPNGMVETPEEVIGRRCDNLEFKANRGLLNESMCELLPALVDAYCGGCAATEPPTASPAYPAFTSPTIRPFGQPTARRTPYPTAYDERHSTNTNNIGMSTTGLVAVVVVVVGLVASFMLISYRNNKTTVQSPDANRSGGSNNNSAQTASIAHGLAVSGTAHGVGAAKEGVKNEENDEKLRPLVLQVLFPQQKDFVPISVTPETPRANSTGRRNDTGLDTTLCSICLEQLDESDSRTTVFGSSCSHVYHRDCILQWLNSGADAAVTSNSSTTTEGGNKEQHDDCPNCRQPMWDPETYQLVKEDIKRRQELKMKIRIAKESAEFDI